MSKRYIFALIAYLLTASWLVAQDAQDIAIQVVECEHGQILNLPESAKVGDYVDFGVKPDNGYELETLTCCYVKMADGQPYSVIVPLHEVNVMQYSFLMPECDHIEISASFKMTNYQVTIADDIENGSVELIEPMGNIVMGTAVKLKATPGTDYLFDAVTITTTSGAPVACTVTDADGDAKYIDFTMPTADVIVIVTFKPVPRYAIKVPQYELGTMTPYPSAMGKPGQRIELIAETAPNYHVTNVKVVAGYEITGGGGSVHAPALMQDEDSTMWFVQQEIPVQKFSSGIYIFTLPEQFDNVLSPNYQDNTEFRVSFDFEYVGPQVLYCEDNTTLYFVNPGQAMKVGDNWRGHIVTQVWGEGLLDTGWEIPGWNEVKDEVTMIDFALDFAQARPKSCYAWFYLFKKAQFVDLKYLNTSEVTNMNSMFTGCKALTTIDVNTFDVSKVTNATSMFRGCDNLTTIYCDSTWNIETSQLMFFGSDNLLGAVAYDASVTDGSMANPHTGYFTGKWDITIPAVEGGTIVSSKLVAFTNDTITLTASPAPGYELQSLTVEAIGIEQLSSHAAVPRGSQVGVIDIGNGDYSFKMPPAPVIVNATFINVTPTAVSLPAADHNQRPTRFNMMGQPVGEGYKGIVIENGTKKIAR